MLVSEKQEKFSLWNFWGRGLVEVILLYNFSLQDSFGVSWRHHDREKHRSFLFNYSKGSYREFYPINDNDRAKKSPSNMEKVLKESCTNPFFWVSRKRQKVQDKGSWNLTLSEVTSWNWHKSTLACLLRKIIGVAVTALQIYCLGTFCKLSNFWFWFIFVT